VTRATSRSDTESTRSEGDVFGPARRVGEILHAVASALSEIPCDDVRGIEIRRITGLKVDCQLTNRLGDRVAAFSVETEANAEAPDEWALLGATADRGTITDPELECIENIPV
jgi:hypothetical protein